MSVLIKLADRLRAAIETRTEIPRPPCHACGRRTRLVAVLDQPIHGEPDSRLAQFVCDGCTVLIEEVVQAGEVPGPSGRKH